MPATDEFSSAMVTRLVVVDRTLVGYGSRIGKDAGDVMPVARWTASLPDVSAPAEKSDRATRPETCGG